MTSFTLLTPPAVEPVTLTELKLHLRLDSTDDDDLATSLITAARQWIESATGLALITQSWQLWLDSFPAAEEMPWDGLREGPVTGFTRRAFVRLPRPPLIGMTSVKTYDDSGAATVWDAANYFADRSGMPGRLCLRTGSAWPVPGRASAGICIEYSAGFGSSGSAVPEPLRLALRQLVSHWYEHRGAAERGLSTRVPAGVEALLDPYRARFTGV